MVRSPSLEETLSQAFIALVTYFIHVDYLAKRFKAWIKADPFEIGAQFFNN
jgi:hypothetical protein